jgi:hypothetical protein
MKIKLNSDLHILDLSDSLEVFDLIVHNPSADYIKNSIRSKSSVLIIYENTDINKITLPHADKCLFESSRYPKYLFISRRNKKKIQDLHPGTPLDYQEMCHFFNS